MSFSLSDESSNHYATMQSYINQSWRFPHLKTPTWMNLYPRWDIKNQRQVSFQLCSKQCFDRCLFVIAATGHLVFPKRISILAVLGLEKKVAGWKQTQESSVKSLGEEMQLTVFGFKVVSSITYSAARCCKLSFNSSFVCFSFTV